MPLQMIFLVALVQGVTEFLPVSSSGHLVLVPVISDQPYQGRAIDVAAHVGTLGAVLVYLWRDMARMTRAMFPGGDPAARRLALMTVLASVPVILAGLIVNAINPAMLTAVTVLAISNIVFAGVLWHADSRHTASRGTGQIGVGEALVIGVAQCFALIPGASRAGVTMTAARYLGFDRLAAARFSLLLSIPAVAGAGTLKGADIIAEGTSTPPSRCCPLSSRLLLGLTRRADFVALLSIGLRRRDHWLDDALACAPDFRIFVWHAAWHRRRPSWALLAFGRLLPSG